MIIPPVGSLGVEAAIPQLSSAPGAQAPGGAAATGAAPGGEAGGFGSALTEAIGSLEQTQNSASGAAQALAAGTATDPESAVVTVENAQLAMELASQIRTKATEATNSIFNTQV